MSRVLLIEPDRILARTYRQSLSRDGHDVVVCSTGQAAIEAADEQSPDVVVIELQLAGHNGVEFLYEFRSYKEWQDVPVIVHSVVAPRAFTGSTAWKLLNVQEYLYKPKTRLSKLSLVLSHTLNTQTV